MGERGRETWWRADRYALRRPRLIARARIIAAIRAAFAEMGFVEVETPALQVAPGMEPHLHAFATEIEGPFGERRRMYLATSPEFAMKKLIAAGEERLFQLARVWRNRERAATHHPEFTMLEWYRAHAAWRDLIPDCVRLLRAAHDAVPAALRPPGGFAWAGRSADPHAEWEILSVTEAFRLHAGIDLLPLAGDVGAFARAAEAIGIRTGADDRWDDVFFRIFLERIEPRLGIGRPTVLHSWPAEMAALARLDPADPRVAERFELYAAGLELANAFGELTDPVEQRRRFEADQALKQRLYGERWPVDEDFVAAVGRMPPTAGIALGLDRLVMLATGASDIEDVLWAPVEPAS